MPVVQQRFISPIGVFNTVMILPCDAEYLLGPVTRKLYDELTGIQVRRY